MKMTWTILFSFLCLNISAQNNSDSVNLMSYNIRLDHAGDNENNWHHRKSDLVEYLIESEADFIGLQEVIHHQLTFIDDLMKDYAYLGVARDDGATLGEYSPILYNHEHWQVAETNTFWLSDTPYRVSRGWDAVCHRICTYGLFIHKTSEDTLLVLNTHFDHVGKVARTESIRLINDFINQFDKSLPIVLMGDFNFTSEDKNYKSLSSRLIDSYTIVQNEEVPSATYNGWKMDSEATRRIDYILVNDHISINKYSVDQPKTKKDRQLSDHYPVAVEINFK